MRTGQFRERMLAGEILAGTFLKTPAFELVEVLADCGLDFLCLDGEHAPFDRARMEACLAMARAQDFPVLVRAASAAPEALLQPLDSGAVGVVVPHVDSPAKAERVARAGRFGHGGRGYAGSTRWAGFGRRGMAELLAQSERETVVIAQIEEPEGVEAAEDIAATKGLDGLFLGPADLSVAYGKTDLDSAELRAALERVGAAARAHGKTFMTFVPDAARAAAWRRYGPTMFFVGSEQAWMRGGAEVAANGVHAFE